MRLLFSLLVLTGWASAQQAVKQEVPDNLAEHAAPVQPLPYSHKKHLALGLRCQQCHTNPDPGAEMTFPASTICMMCHNTIAKDRPAIVKLTELAKASKPIPWVRIYQVTPGVTWTHRRHLQAGMQCVMCHGDVARLDAMAQTTGVVAMASCISCHQAHNANTTCDTCHAWPPRS
jgi:Cytochrome c7 and related cytochrome c